MSTNSGQHQRPKSPNIQIYRPQMTSIMSIANRISAIILSFGIIAFVIWLVAIASGGILYSLLNMVFSTTMGQLGLFFYVFIFLFHVLCGIRHVYWDSGRGFRLSSIYMSGWAVLFSSIVLTLLTWYLARK